MRPVRQPTHSAAASTLPRFLRRLALLVLVWVGLNGTDWDSWIIGCPTVVAAAWVSVRLLPRGCWRWTLRGGIGFVGFFLRESLRGGWDVAGRALGWGPALSPAIVRHRLRLPAGPARLFFCGAVGLLPGTTVVAVEEQWFHIHALDCSPRVAEELSELEGRVAALFGAAMPAETEAGQ